MSLYKIHIGKDGNVRGFGPNDGVYQPYLEDGDTIEFSDTLPGPTREDQLAAIEAKYSQKQTEIDSALVNALWVGGPQEASIRGSLMAKRQKIIDDRDAEIAALFA